MSKLTESLYPWYCALTGRGGQFLAFRRELHSRRAAAEKRVLAEAERDSSLFRPNVCPACERRIEPRTEFKNPVGYHFAICPGDGTVFMDPLPTDETLERMYNDPAESFLWIQDKTDTQPDVKPMGAEDYQAILRMMQPQKGQRLLEIGCANGAFLLTARQMFDVEGCELNGTTAEEARRLGFKVTTGGIDSVSGDSRFDLVVMLQVIEHLPRPAETLAHIRRLLVPGGYFYFNTPSIDSASFNLLRERHVHVSSFGHISLFNEQSLSRLAERTGFDTVAYEHCGGSDLALHDLLSLRLAPSRFRHRMGMYSPRFYFACEAVDRALFGLPSAWLRPSGNESYQRAIWRKPIVR